MAKIVSLRQVKKARKRADDRQAADENAARFGRTKAEKHQDNCLRDRAEKHLDDHKKDDA